MDAYHPFLRLGGEAEAEPHFVEFNNVVVECERREDRWHGKASRMEWWKLSRNAVLGRQARVAAAVPLGWRRSGRSLWASHRRSAAVCHVVILRP